MPIRNQTSRLQWTSSGCIKRAWNDLILQQIWSVWPSQPCCLLGPSEKCTIRYMANSHLSLHIPPAQPNHPHRPVHIPATCPSTIEHPGNRQWVCNISSLLTSLPALVTSDPIDPLALFVFMTYLFSPLSVLLLFSSFFIQPAISRRIPSPHMNLVMLKVSSC